MSFNKSNLENERFWDAAHKMISGYQEIVAQHIARTEARADMSLSLRNREIAMEMADMFRNYAALDMEEAADKVFGTDLVHQVVAYIHSEHCSFGPLLLKRIPVHKAIMQRAGVLVEGA